MFFKIDEKTIAEMIKNQQEREAKRDKDISYKGHKLKFAMSSDGHETILPDPPLVTMRKTIDTDPEEVGTIEVLTPAGWVKRE